MIKASPLEYIKPLIKELRNKRNVNENWDDLKKLILKFEDHILSHFSLRWLVSICDTYADYGTPVERRNAYLISLLVIMARLSDSYRHRIGVYFSEQKLDTTKFHLYEGLYSFNPEHEDTCLNMCKRMTRLLEETPFFLKMYQETLRRMLKHKTLLSDYASLSSKPDKMFPMNATEIPDNYGIK